MRILPTRSSVKPRVLAILGALFLATGLLLLVLTHPASDQQDDALHFFVGLFVGIGAVLEVQAFLNLRQSRRP
jgi:hypothetical protein